MPRAIVRYSIDGESSNDTGNAIRAVLEDHGFYKVGTASFDADDAEFGDILSGVKALVTLLENPPGGGTLDHLWVYVDDPQPPACNY